MIFDDFYKIMIGSTQVDEVYLGNTLIYPVTPPVPVVQPNNEIWYTSTDDSVIYFPSTSRYYGEMPKSNTYSGGKGIIKFDNNLTYLGAYAFFEKRKLKSVSLPSTITKIYDCAFENCENLKTITLSDAITTIEDRAFEGTGLSSFTISDSVTYLGRNAFSESDLLESITIGNSITNIRNNTFYNCVKLQNITYTGTMEQWNSITKGDYWNAYVPATVVHCTDGNVYL